MQLKAKPIIFLIGRFGQERIEGGKRKKITVQTFFFARPQKLPNFSEKKKSGERKIIHKNSI
jgi:hypothetical protein